MADRIEIDSVDLGNLYGADFCVMAEASDGMRYILNHSFTCSRRARGMAMKVQLHGSIDPTHWTETYPRYGSGASENELAEAAMYEQSLANGVGDITMVPDSIRALI